MLQRSSPCEQLLCGLVHPLYGLVFPCEVCCGVDIDQLVLQLLVILASVSVESVCVIPNTSCVSNLSRDGGFQCIIIITCLRRRQCQRLSMWSGQDPLPQTLNNEEGPKQAKEGATRLMMQQMHDVSLSIRPG